MPKVSVIIPSFNQEDYLEDALKSLLGDFTDFEVVVVNDGSTNYGAAEKIQSVIEKFPELQIKFINQENQGVCIARNNAIKEAAGEYIMPLDADDKITNSYLKEASEILDRDKEIGIVYCRAEFFGEKNGVFKLSKPTMLNMLSKNRIFNSAMFRKSDWAKVGGYKPIMKEGCEDWEFGISLLEIGLKPYKIDKTYFWYRKIHTARTSSAVKPLNYIKIRLKIIRLHYNLYKKFGIIIYPLLIFMICMNIAAWLYKKLKLICRISEYYLRSLRYRKPLKYGITKHKRKTQIIISLTSFKERIKEVHLAINSLLHQSLKPDKIILWLSEEEFPNKEEDLPESLTKLVKYGLTINFCYKNIKSYKKIIPTLQNYPNDIIVLADDDLYYRKNWLKILYESYLRNPDAIHCHRLHRICFNEENAILPCCYWEKSVKKQFENEIYLGTSGAGMLFKGKNLFYKEITNQDLFLKLAPNADDIWIWAMIILNNTRIQLAKNNISDLICVNPKRDFCVTQGSTLYKTNGAYGNDRQLSMILEHYPEIENILSKLRGV